MKLYLHIIITLYLYIRDLKRTKEEEDVLHEVVNTSYNRRKKKKLQENTNKDEICRRLIEYTEEGLPKKNEIQEIIMNQNTRNIRNTRNHNKSVLLDKKYYYLYKWFSI